MLSPPASRPPTAFVGITDRDWFEKLRSLPDLDEVNFWQPSPGGRFAALQLGEPFLFKLHRPIHRIVGGGFFGHYAKLPLSLAWEAFGAKNGAASLPEMRSRVERYRRLGHMPHEDYEIGCIVLEQPFFLEPDDWLRVPDWHMSIQRGRRYRLDEEPGLTLWTEVERRLDAGRWAGAGILLREPGAPRYGAPVSTRPRLGQGSFQVAVVEAYQRRCAFTGEKVLPVLEAAHIRPYAEGGEHRVDNGLLLRRDFHVLFERGYVTVTPDLEIVVSKRLRQDFDNGGQYAALSGERLRLPTRREDRPNPDFLDWHNLNRFVA